MKQVILALALAVSIGAVFVAYSAISASAGNNSTVGNYRADPPFGTEP